jgi:hypothetical protein
MISHGNNLLDNFIRRPTNNLNENINNTYNDTTGKGKTRGTLRLDGDMGIYGRSRSLNKRDKI